MAKVFVVTGVLWGDDTPEKRQEVRDRMMFRLANDPIDWFRMPREYPEECTSLVITIDPMHSPQGKVINAKE